MSRVVVTAFISACLMGAAPISAETVAQCQERNSASFNKLIDEAEHASDMAASHSIGTSGYCHYRVLALRKSIRASQALIRGDKCEAYPDQSEIYRLQRNIEEDQSMLDQTRSFCSMR